MKASKALRIAQPALSIQIKKLEHQLKRKLFQKSGRRLMLTAEGLRAFAFCKRAFEATEEFSDYLKHSDQNVRPRLKIGVSPEIERPFFLDALSVIFRDGSKDGKSPLVSMQTAPPETLSEKLSHRELDAAITGKPIYGPEIKTAVQMKMPVVSISNPSFFKKQGLSGTSSLSTLLKTRSNAGLVLPSETLRLRIETDLYLQKIGIKNPVVFESDILAAVIRASLDGVGIAFLPLPYIKTELKQGSLVPVGALKAHWRHSVYFSISDVKNNATLISPIKEHFETIAQECKAFA